MADLTTAAYAPNSQELPEYLSYSTYVVTVDNVVYTTETVVQIPQIYYGPSIPLGQGWSFGGSTSPASTVSLTTTGDVTDTRSNTLTAPLTPSSLSTTSSPSPPSSPSSSALLTITASPTLSGTTPTESPSQVTIPAASPSRALPTSSLIPAILIPIIVFLILAIGFWLWRQHKHRHAYGAVNTQSPAVGFEGTPDTSRPRRLNERVAEGWLPNLFPVSGLRQRSTSARHGGRVPSTNLWGSAVDQPGDDTDYEVVPMPDVPAAGTTTPREDPDRTPGRCGLDGTRGGDLGEILPVMGDVTPTRGHPSSRNKLMAAIGIGLGRSPRDRPAVDTGEVSPTTGRQPKISQTDSSTPGSGQNFYPVGTAEKRRAKEQSVPGHRKSESFPSVAGQDRDLFYTYPADDADQRADDLDDSGTSVIHPEGTVKTSKKSRFSALFPEEFSSSGGSRVGGSTGSRDQTGQLPRIHSQSSLERDLAELGMPIGLGAGLGIHMDGGRSLASSTSQLRFPVPPESSRPPSETGHGGIAATIERKATSETLETRYYSLPYGESILTRRSRQSTTSDDEGADPYSTTLADPEVDEYGRRIGNKLEPSSNGSHGVSSAVRPSGPSRRPSTAMESGTDDFDTLPRASSHSRPRPLPLSALPSPTYTETPPSAANRFSVLAGSITSLFGAKRASMVSSSLGDENLSLGDSQRPDLLVATNPHRQSYAGQPLVGEDVYREALLSGHQARERGDTLSPIVSRGGRQESSGETALVTSSEEGSGETFGVQRGRGRVVTPGNRAHEANLMALGVHPASTGIGEFGQVVVVNEEVLRLPDDARKASALFFPNSPYSPAQASSQAASIQEAASKLSSNTPVGSFRSAGTHVSGDTQSSGESLGVVTGAQYSIAAVRGKRSMPRLVNTPDALAGLIPRTDTPPSDSTGPPVTMTVPPPSARLASAQQEQSPRLPPTSTAAYQSTEVSLTSAQREKEKWWLGRFGRT